MSTPKHTPHLYALLVGLFLMAGCDETDGIPQDGGPADDANDADDDSDEPTVVDPGPACLYALPVDMLWVIDNSHSMDEEQQNLAVNFPSLVETLTAPIDVDDDGDEDYPPVDDLRVAVVTTDMGVGESSVIGCDASGDGGEMVSTSRSLEPECSGITVGPPPWIEFHVDDDVEAFSERFACLAKLGTEGCGYEQHLDAMTAALTTLATAGGPNEGFMRESSLVVIVFVTDEDDCSTRDDALFATTPLAEEVYGPSGTRCAFNPDMLGSISSFIAALDPFRMDREGGFAVAAIAGVPPELEGDGMSIDYDALLADERMQYRMDDIEPPQLVPACSSQTIGSAVPARRLIEFIRDFAPGERGLVQSICTTDFRPAMQAIAHLVARRLCDRPY